MLKIGLFLQTRWVSKEVDRVSAWDIPSIAQGGAHMVTKIQKWGNSQGRRLRRAAWT